MKSHRTSLMLMAIIITGCDSTTQSILNPTAIENPATLTETQHEHQHIHATNITHEHEHTGNVEIAHEHDHKHVLE